MNESVAANAAFLSASGVRARRMMPQLTRAQLVGEIAFTLQCIEETSASMPAAPSWLHQRLLVAANRLRKTVAQATTRPKAAKRPIGSSWATEADRRIPAWDSLTNGGQQPRPKFW